MTASRADDVASPSPSPGSSSGPTTSTCWPTLREPAPVHRTADGLLAVSRYEDVRAISRDPDPLRVRDGAS